MAHYWTVEYDLRGEAPYRQRVLPHPSVNLVVTDGRARTTAAGPTWSWIAGVIRGHYDETLRDAGWVVGARFRPGGFRPFLDAPVATIADRFLPLTDVFGSALGGRSDDRPGRRAGPPGRHHSAPAPAAVQ